MTAPHAQPPRPGHQPPPHYNASPMPPAGHSLANYGPPPLQPGPTPLAAKKVFTPYVALWSVMGGLAAGYMAFLVLSPHTDLVPNSAGLSDQRFASRLASEVSGIKDSMAMVQLELAKLKTDIAGQDTRGKVLGDQLAALERKLGGEPAAGIEASVQETPAPAAPPAKAAAKQPAAAPAPEVQAKAQATPNKPRLVNGEPDMTAADLGLETSSVPEPAAPAAPQAKAAKAAVKTVAVTEPVDFGEAVVKPAAAAPKPMGVQISSGASIDSLRLSWSLLSDRHSDALKNLEARYVARGDEAAPTYDLIAGPIKSKADAQKVCKALAAKNVPCKVGDFLGEQL